MTAKDLKGMKMFYALFGWWFMWVFLFIKTENNR